MSNTIDKEVLLNILEHLIIHVELGLNAHSNSNFKTETFEAYLKGKKDAYILIKNMIK
jgi:hypothetical protein